MAVEFATFMAMGFVVGVHIDSRYGTRPWGSLAGFLIGLIAGALSVNRAVSSLSARGPGKGKKR